MKEYIGKVLLDYEYYTGKDIYSDGEIEDELLDIVKNSTTDEFNNIIMQKKKWPILYHLSNIRENIIEWIPFTKDDRVLEVGSGCGAITGVVAKKAKHVTCIELSKKRSMINAYRNKDKENIEIRVGNFEDIKISDKYDYITLIGVFEYAQSYINQEEPYECLLKQLYEKLDSKGKLIIAIENKMGMKYWAGCKEDHVDMLFEGLEDYSNTKRVKTFTKNEIENMLKKLDIKDYSFYYPYPDYKFPNTIYSDDYLPNEGELTDNMRNFDMDRIKLFDESKVYDMIIRNQLFPIYSNSYLIIVEKGNN